MNQKALMAATIGLPMNRYHQDSLNGLGLGYFEGFDSLPATVQTTDVVALYKGRQIRIQQLEKM